VFIYLLIGKDMNSFSKILFLLFSLATIATPTILRSQQNYDLNAECEEIYQLIIDLRFGEAVHKIDHEKKVHPQNLIPYYLENYIDFFSIIIREEKSDFDRRKGHKKERIKLLKGGDPTSPYFRLLQAETHLQWAIARLKFEEYFKAIREIQTAYGLLKENQIEFPDFHLNLKGLAMVHAIAGTIPDHYKSLVEWLTGIEGNIQKSLQESDRLIVYCQEKQHVFLNEAFVLKSFIELYLNNRPQEAWTIIWQSGLKTQNSPLARFVAANIAMRSGHTDEALHILQEFSQREDQEEFLYLQFMQGVNLLRKLDPAAKSHLLHFVREFRGQHYIKEAYQFLAWASLIFDNNPDLSRYYYTQCLQNGNELMDEDKSAQLEAKSGALPDPLLLQIRLLFDGAYYQRAHDLLLENEKMLKEKFPLDYVYRKARIHHALGDFSEALLNYEKVIKMEEAKNLYQQCNAALQMGLIYEKTNNSHRAEHYFSLCLKMEPNKYKAGLHNKAKAGLSRLKH
jgi:hypothetical protein